MSFCFIFRRLFLDARKRFSFRANVHQFLIFRQESNFQKNLKEIAQRHLVSEIIWKVQILKFHGSKFCTGELKSSDKLWKQSLSASVTDKSYSKVQEAALISVKNLQQKQKRN